MSSFIDACRETSSFYNCTVTDNVHVNGNDWVQMERQEKDAVVLVRLEGNTIRFLHSPKSKKSIVNKLINMLELQVDKRHLIPA